MAEHFEIAIDGPAGSGKSTTAAGVAEQLNIIHLDTGAMYRAITLFALNQNIGLEETDKLSALSHNMELIFKRGAKGQRIYADGADVTGQIRGERVTRHVSSYCAVPRVRQAMVNKQRQAAGQQSIVLEGRDIGTVVLPQARFKFFITASIEARANRRIRDFEKLGEKVEIQKVMADLEERDRKDATRAISPLKKANDAIEIDTTDMSIAEQIYFIVKTVRKELNL